MYHDTHTNVAHAAADGDLFDEHDKFTRFLFQVQPQTLNPKPQTLNPKPQTPNPEP